MHRPSRLALVSAFLTLYLIWGSTYLAIRIANETLPPFLLAGSRFMVAGLVLMFWSRARGTALPTLRQWPGVIGVGACLVVLSNVPVVWAERHLPSGTVALFAAVSPLMIAFFNGRRTGTALGSRRAMGLALGTVGMVLLGSASFELSHEVMPLVVLGVASLSWSIGSTYGRDWGQPTDWLMSSASQMFAGGMLALVVSLAAGEMRSLDVHAVSGTSVLAWSYLTLFGSLVAYPVFQWLLGVADATQVSSYTYVNPVIALALGFALMGEQVSMRTLLATAVLMPAVGLVVTGGGKPVLPATNLED
jgi:drug/metabolite transporter (DMT)-like permease